MTEVLPAVVACGDGRNGVPAIRTSVGLRALPCLRPARREKSSVSVAGESIVPGIVAGAGGHCRAFATSRAGAALPAREWCLAAPPTGKTASL